MKPIEKKLSHLQVTMWLAAASVLLGLLSTLLPASGPPAGAGESTYKTKCAMCHGADGSGNTAMGKKLKLRDLRSPEVQKQSDAQLLAIIGKGKSPMQGYEKQLGQEKMREVVEYLRELAKKQ